MPDLQPTRLFTLAALLLAAATPMRAQTATDSAATKPVALDPFVITAEREAGNFLLGQDEIARTNAVDLTQLFANQSTLAVGSGTLPAQTQYRRDGCRSQPLTR